MELSASEKMNNEKIREHIKFLKEYITDSLGRSEFSEVFVYEINEVACLVCANAKLMMYQVASLIKRGEDTPFDTQMNNEAAVPVPDSKTIENGEYHNIVIHKDDIGSIGEMGNESMPHPFNWITAKTIPGSATVN